MHTYLLFKITIFLLIIVSIFSYGETLVKIKKKLLELKWLRYRNYLVKKILKEDFGSYNKVYIEWIDKEGKCTFYKYKAFRDQFVMHKLVEKMLKVKASIICTQEMSKSFADVIILPSAGIQIEKINRFRDENTKKNSA